MYVHIGDTVSVPIESIITMVHAKGGKSHKSPIHHYESLEYIAMVPAVSYTHLDVYKRQILAFLAVNLAQRSSFTRPILRPFSVRRMSALS